MRRSDRLSDLLQILRDGRLHRAEDLATRLGVTPRTIYRDMETLAASGIPVAGERGRGYRATAPVTLPPLNLSLTELEALHVGLAVLADAAQDDLRDAAASLAAKIDAALPEDQDSLPAGPGLAVRPFADAAAGFRHAPTIRAAIRARQKLSIAYRNPDGTVTDRTIRPLRIDYWGRFWTATAWCERRDGFDRFRLERIEALRVLPQLFVDEPGKSLEDYRARGE
jgi:predicted DNA-binding transcriptional regulator YafY